MPMNRDNAHWDISGFVGWRELTDGVVLGVESEGDESDIGSTVVEHALIASCIIFLSKWHYSNLQAQGQCRAPSVKARETAANLPITIARMVIEVDSPAESVVGETGWSGKGVMGEVDTSGGQIADVRGIIWWLELQLPGPTLMSRTTVLGIFNLKIATTVRVSR